MSISEPNVPTPEPRVALTVNTHDPAAAVRVVDGALQEVARSVGTALFELPPGLYEVRAKLGSAVYEQPVVLREKPVRIDVPPLRFASAAPLTDTRLTHEYHIDNAARHSRQLHATHGSGARLYLFVRAFTSRAGPRPGEGAGDLTAGLSLHRVGSGEAVPLAFAKSDPERPHEDPWAAFDVELDPGAYVLRAVTHDANGAAAQFEQAVILSKGWQAQVFLLAQRRPGGAARWDIDLPSATVFMAATDTPGFIPSDDDARLVDVARLALTSERATISSSEQNGLLHGKFANPMHGLLGGHVLARRLAHDDGQRALLKEVVKNLRHLLGADHPDVEALALLAGVETDHVFAHPPMLQASWQAIVGASYERKDVVPVKSFASDVATRICPDGPWLTWLRPNDEQSVQALDSAWKNAAAGPLFAGATDLLFQLVRPGVARWTSWPAAVLNNLPFRITAVRDEAISECMRLLNGYRVEALSSQASDLFAALEEALRSDETVVALARYLKLPPASVRALIERFPLPDVIVRSARLLTGDA